MRKFLLCGACLWLALSDAAQAQLVTGTTVTTDANGNVTQTQTTTANGPSATNATATAQSAELAAAKAAIPGSGITPGTTIGTAAGTEEGNLLAALATNQAARYIISQIAAKKVLVFVGATSSPDVTPWLLFQEQSDRLIAQFKSDEDGLKALLHRGGVRPEFIGPALVVAGSLLSYGYTSYQTGGIGLTPDDYLMDVSLVQLKPDWQIYAQRVDLKMPDEIHTRMTTMDSDAVESSKLIVEAQRYVANLSLDKYKTDATAQINKAAASAFITALGADITSYTALTTALGGASSAGSGSLTAILQAYAVNEALTEPDKGVAYIKVHSASVGTVSKANFISNLFTMPLYTSVGLVVSYVYYPGGTSPLITAPNPKAGVFEVITPYHTVGTVWTALKVDSEGHCDTPAVQSNPQKPDPDIIAAGKLCPVIFKTTPLN